MRSRIGFAIMAATAIVAAPAFTETNDGPGGMWKGSIDRNGAHAPVVLRLGQKGGIWMGTADVGGTASPLSKLKVDGNRVEFKVKGQGTFQGTCSKDSLTGSVSGSEKKGTKPASFTLKRQKEERDATMRQI